MAKIALFLRLLLLALYSISITGEKFSEMYQASIENLAHLVGQSIIPPIRRIVDVGANTGDWSRLVNSYFPEAQIFMIEGNRRLVSELSQTGFPFTFALIGDRPRPVQFHSHLLHHTGGSIFREQGYDHMNPTKLTVSNGTLERLDDVLERNGIQEVDFLKMDIQGAEFLALHGATETLKKATYVTLEVSIHQYNPGAAQFTDINIFLEKRGYRLYDIIDLRPIKAYEPMIRTLVQADFIWAKADSPIFTSSIYAAPPESVFDCRRIGKRGKGAKKRKESP
jgi:FkbM family methyltransferase